MLGKEKKEGKGKKERTRKREEKKEHKKKYLNPFHRLTFHLKGREKKNVKLKENKRKK